MIINVLKKIVLKYKNQPYQNTKMLICKGYISGKYKIINVESYEPTKMSQSKK